jgi:peptidoglycan-associated lipoprotein
MFPSARIARTLVATIALAVASGCAQQASPPQAATTSGPELAGIWYQIYFDTNSPAINARGEMIVKTVADVVANSGSTRVTVIGKTDRVGAPPANMALSRRRADAVRDALIAAGVPAARIDTTWTGEGKQQVATPDDVADQGNRVVDVTVVKLPS